MKREVILNGKLAVITGATSGIGKAIAKQLARSGMSLILIGKSQVKLDACGLELTKLGATIFTYVADLANSEQLIKITQKIVRKHKDIAIVVQSAGVIRLGTLNEVTIEDFNYQNRVNLKAPIVISKAVLSTLIANKGQMVFINSSAVNNPKPGTGFYAATKAGLKAFADGLRTEVNKHEVRVISIYPGSSNTPMQKEIARKNNKKYIPELLLQPEDVAEVVINTLKLPLTAEITDVFIRPFKKE